MKTHTSSFKENIKKHGRELDSKITYTENGQQIILGSEDLNSVTPYYEGSILKSVMKQLDVDSNVDIPVGTVINYQFGVKVNNSYEYINFGNYVVMESEKQEDNRSYKLTCYDKMLYSMINYVDMSITYPISVRDYIGAICTHLGLTFKNASSTFANYDKMIPNEKYLTDDGDTLGYKFRDVLDELAQVTASTICINEDDDELEIRYITGGVPSKNLLDKSAGFQNGYINTSGNFISQNQTATFNQKIAVENGESYCFSANGNVDNMVISMFGSSDNYIGRTKTTNTYKAVQTIDNSNVSYIKVAVNYNNSSTMTASIINNLQLMVEKNSDRTSPYVDYDEGVLETIDEEFLKDVNVNFSEEYGPVNTIVLSRSADSDIIYYPAILPENPIEIKIKDNQIMNDNNRDTYMPDIYDKLNGLQFYLNDFNSPGICYLNLCDRYNVEIGENIYPCIMLNDEVRVTQGLEEIIHTETLEQSVVDYSKADKTDRRINQTNLIVDKQQGEIDALVESTQDLTDYINVVEGDDEITLTQTMASDGSVNYVEITGFTPMSLYPGMAYPGNNVYPNVMTTYILVTEKGADVNETYIDLGVQLGSTDKLIIGPNFVKAIRTGQTINKEVTNVIKTYEETTKVYIKYLDNLHYKCEYLKANDFTRQFATQAQLGSQISITDEKISLKVSKGDVISSINQSAEQVSIDASKINLNGVVTANEKFKILQDGTMSCENAVITGSAIVNGEKFNVDSEGNLLCNNATMNSGTFNGLINGGSISISGAYSENNPYIEVKNVNYPNTEFARMWDSAIVIYDYTVGESGTNPLIRTECDNGFAELNGEVVNAFGFNNVSLEERKKNFEKLDNALEIIKNTDIYKFHYKGDKDEDKKHIGLVIGDNYNYSKELTNKQNDAVDLYSMVGTCFKAIKEQQQIIEDLQKEIKKLKEVR